jgi:DNA-binding NtrC family response regulator
MARLVVVEREAGARAALEAALRAAGHAVLATATAAEAAGRVAAGGVDAVLLGCAPGDRGRVRLLEQCHARAVPVLLGSGGPGDPADPRRAARALAAAVAASPAAADEHSA